MITVGLNVSIATIMATLKSIVGSLKLSTTSKCPYPHFIGRQYPTPGCCFSCNWTLGKLVDGTPQGAWCTRIQASSSSGRLICSTIPHTGDTDHEVLLDSGSSIYSISQPLVQLLHLAPSEAPPVQLLTNPSTLPFLSIQPIFHSLLLCLTTTSLPNKTWMWLVPS